MYQVCFKGCNKYSVQSEQNCLQKKVNKANKLYEDMLVDFLEMEDDLFKKNSELLETYCKRRL